MFLFKLYTKGVLPPLLSFQSVYFSSENSSSSDSSGGATFLVELKPFHKTFGKTASSSGALIGTVRSYVFFSPPPKWKPQKAPGAAADLECLISYVWQGFG
jgi:hypothetical protein